jgi:hypothetical protein
MAWGDANNGYLAIDRFGSDDTSGYLLRTSDGGKSWRPQLVAPSLIHGNGLVATAPKRAFALADGNQLFYTAAGGDQGTNSVVTITSNVKHLGRKGKTVTIRGRIAPAVAGADVYVSFRGVRGGSWTVLLPRPTGANGSFTLRRKVRKPAVVVAQWLGDADRNGDGSNLVTLKR